MIVIESKVVMVSGIMVANGGGGGEGNTNGMRGEDGTRSTTRAQGGHGGDANGGDGGDGGAGATASGQTTTDAQNGATEVFPRQHLQGYLSPRDGEYHQLAADAIDTSHGVALELAPGDVAFFGGFMPHRSAPNRTDRWRRQLYLSYNAGRDGGEQRDAHYCEFHEWLVKKYAEYGKLGVYFR